LRSDPRETSGKAPSDKAEVPDWASGAWEALSETLKNDVGEPGFATWLSTAAVVGANETELTLGVPYRLQKEHITQDYLPDIERHLALQLGRVVSVEVIVSEDLEAAAADELADAQPSDEGAVKLTVEVRRREKTGQPRVLGRMENNIARKALFDLQPSRGAGSAEVERPDLIGTTALQYTMGQLGVLEMDVFTWALGRWKRGEKRLRFSKRELGRDMGLSWGGKTGQELTDALLRLRGTSVKGEVWLAETKRYILRDISLFQELTVDEHRESREGPAIRPGQVEVVLSDWLDGQLQAGQYASLDFEKYRQDIITPFARRLYPILECEEGTEDGTHVEFVIDKSFISTMGTRDKNQRRFRSRLSEAGKIICKARPHYTSIRVEVDTKRSMTLIATRSPEWQRQRKAWRRAENLAGWRDQHDKIIDVVGRVVGVSESETDHVADEAPLTVAVAE
jgi:hypothetical protein